MYSMNCLFLCHNSPIHEREKKILVKESVEQPGKKHLLANRFQIFYKIYYLP